MKCVRGVLCPRAGFVAAIGALLAVSAWANPALQGEMGMAYQSAYDAFTRGEVREGAIELIEYLRTVPGDDLAAADALVGPSQLLGFSIASLMTWGDRGHFMGHVLRPNEYPSDALLIRTMEYLSGLPHLSIPARGHLERLAGGDHLAIATAAAGILTYGQRDDDRVLEHPAIRNLIENYPQLEATRAIVEAPVYRAFSKARASGGQPRALLAHAERLDGRQAAVFAISPGLARAAEALPSMRTEDIDEAVLAGWAIALENEQDPRARYTLITLLARGCESSEERALARPALEALAAEPPSTPDVVRARAVLASFALDDHDAQTAFEMAQSLVSLGILPATAERSMYEVMMQTSQQASRYFTRYGHVQLALQTHEALANKFPGTTLGRIEAEKAQALHDHGLRVSIETVREEVDQRLRNAENMESGGNIARAREHRTLARETLESIIAHTPSEGLRANLIDRLNRLDTPVPPPPPRVNRIRTFEDVRNLDLGR
jgi:hypothetical protein